MKTIEKKIIGIVEELLMVTLDTVEVMEVSFEKLGLDSFLFMRLLVEVENEFGITFEPDLLEEGIFENLKSLVEWVSKKVGSDYDK